jgi:hypothetical protein
MAFSKGRRFGLLEVEVQVRLLGFHVRQVLHYIMSSQQKFEELEEFKCTIEIFIV